MELRTLQKNVEAVIRADGKLIRSMEYPKIYSKEGHANFVTEADLASQNYLKEQLKVLLPQANFFAEEQEENVLRPGYNWILDPLDGTTNFMRGYNPSAVSIGLVRDGKGVLGLVYDIFGDELFSAVSGEGAFCNGKPIRISEIEPENALIAFGSSPYYRDKAEETFRMIKKLFLSCGDIRRSGSAALDLCHVAAGRCDGFYEALLSPWDYAAASVILQEAGGKIGTLPGETFGYEKRIPILAGNPAVYQLIQELASA